MDTGGTFSSLTSVFFFCDPGRIRPGPVGDLARDPRFLVWIELYKFTLTLRSQTLYSMLLLDTGGDVHPLLSSALFCRVGGGSSTEAAAVGADLSALNEYRLGEGGMCIPACIAHIVGDTVGVVAGMGIVFFGSFAEATCAVLVLYPLSGVLGILRILGKHRGFPCSSSDILTLVLRTMISRVRDAHGVVEKALKVFSPFCSGLTTPVIVGLSWISAHGVLSSGTICSRRFLSA